MANEPTSKTPTDGGTAKSAVRVVHEPRACMGCGYDLRGQSVVSEPHYGWMVVRCPECGLVLPMHAFGASRRVVTTTAGALSALWVIATLVITVVLGVSVFAIARVSFAEAVVGERVFSSTGESAYRTDTLRGLFVLAWVVPTALPFGLVGAAMTAGRGVRAMILGGLSAAFVSAMLWLLAVVNAMDQLETGFASAMDRTLVSWSGIVWAAGILILAGVLIVGVFAVSPALLRLIVGWTGPRWLVFSLGGLWSAAGKPVPVADGGGDGGPAPRPTMGG